MSSVTLRATQANLSIVNPQTNQYMQYGRMVVIALRKESTIAIVALSAQKKPIMAVQCTADIQWTLQNSVYCSFVSQGHRGLFQFASASEAELFTALALTGKLANPPGVICIDQRQGPAINPDFPMKVSYKCYDVMAKKIDEPVMEQDNFEISPTDDTPIRSIAKLEAGAGSTFVVQFPHNIVAVVHSISETANLPMFGGASQAQANEQEAGEDAGGKKKKKSKRRQSEAPPNESAPVQPQQPIQPQIIQAPPNSVSPNSMYDSQLESIRNEMQSKFTELTQMIASLRRTLASQSNIPLASDILVSSVQRLLKENQIKDQQIAEKKQLLDILSTRQSDTRERDSLRIQLAELGSKLSEQRKITREKNEEQETLSKKIQDLQAELSIKKVNAESSINELRLKLDEDKNKQIAELNEQRKEVAMNAQKAEEEYNNAKTEYEKAVEENKRLREMTSKDKTKQLKSLEKKLPLVMSQAVKGMIAGVYRLISNNFDEDEEYDAETIRKAIRAAMQRQANAMLNAMEKDTLEDDDDEEEEEEDNQQE